MKFPLTFISILLLSHYCISQTSFDGLYINLQKKNNLDTSNHAYSRTYLKIIGNKCFMDISTVLIKGNDTTFISNSRLNSYFRGSYTIISGKLSLMMGEIIIDYFERTMHLNENGIPTPNRQIKYLLGEPINEGLRFDKNIFKRVQYIKVLESEDLNKF